MLSPLAIIQHPLLLLLFLFCIHNLFPHKTLVDAHCFSNHTNFDFFSSVAILIFQYHNFQLILFFSLQLFSIHFPANFTSIYFLTIHIIYSALSSTLILFPLPFLLSGHSYWHECAAFQRSSFGRSRSGGRLLAMT